MSLDPHDEFLDLASLYTLGLLDAESAEIFEQHLKSCPICESEMREFAELAARVLEVMNPTEPSADLPDQPSEHINSPAPAGMIFRAGEGQWRDSRIPGLSVKRLFVDPITGSVTSLIRMAPGAVYPAHRHAALEHCYVLEGDLALYGYSLYRGDYEVATTGQEHPSATTKDGCLLLVINNRNDQQLA